METHLQESAGLRRVAPIQSPVPVGQPMGPVARVILGTFVVLMALGYVAHLVPLPAPGGSPGGQQGGPRAPAAQTP